MKFSSFIAKIRPKRKWLEITWKKLKFLRWEIPWIDKAYVFGKRFHHIELGLILIFVGWILVIHDWFVHERPKVAVKRTYVTREDGSLELKAVRIKKVVPSAIATAVLNGAPLMILYRNLSVTAPMRS